ncbi:hypothetical protein ACFWIJ_08520 [Streptomyces sp. NPDC127079]|uniref:hypothetical protein n=1 Tax=Streptomyces sp. NPDC127079 TaxID=3347132 RepID=UPI0036643A4D
MSVSDTARTVAVIAPYDAGNAYPLAFARHGWRTVAVVPEHRLRPPAYRNAAVAAGYTGTVVHRGVRQTVKALRALGVSAVVAAGAGGVEPAERIAWQLGLPGADPVSSPLRYDRGAQAARLSRLGIPALRGVRATSPATAVAWVRACPLPGYLLAPATAGTPVEPVECADALQVVAAWQAVRDAAVRYSGSPDLVLTERPPPGRFTVRTVTRPGPDGRPEHVVTALRARPPSCRTAQVPSSRTVQLLRHRTARVLDALGVVCGPATTRFALGADDEPLLVDSLAAGSAPHVPLSPGQSMTEWPPPATARPADVPPTVTRNARILELRAPREEPSAPSRAARLAAPRTKPVQVEITPRFRDACQQRTDM